MKMPFFNRDPNDPQSTEIPAKPAAQPPKPPAPLQAKPMASAPSAGPAELGSTQRITLTPKPIAPRTPASRSGEPEGGQANLDRTQKIGQFNQPLPARASAPAPEPEQQPAAPPGTTIKFPMRAIMSQVPHSLFAMESTEEIAALYVHIPMEWIVPQLPTGKVRVRLAELIALVPAEALRQPVPVIPVYKSVALPLATLSNLLPTSHFPNQPATKLSDTVRLPVEDILQHLPIGHPLARKPVAPTPAAAPESEPEVVSEPAAEEVQAVAPSLAEPEYAPEPVTAESVEAETVEPVIAEAAPIMEAAVEPEPVPEPVVEAAPVIERRPPPPPSELLSTGAQRQFLLDLNQCSAEDLLRVRGVGPSLARHIIEYRDAHGSFQTLEELRAVPGVGRKTFHALAGPPPRKLNRLVGITHEQELPLQEVTAKLSSLVGIVGCVVVLDHGEFIAGRLPEGLDLDQVCTFGPHIAKNTRRTLHIHNLGEVQRVTVFTDHHPITIYRAGKVYLIVVHDDVHFSKTQLRVGQRISLAIGQICRQRVIV